MGASGYFHDVVDRRDVDPDAADDLDDVDFDTSEILLKGGDVASPAMQRYFADLERQTREAYDIAEACRKKGLDPETFVEIPRAEDLAARVEALVGPKGVAERIRELSREMNRELVSLTVAKEVAAGRFGDFDSKEAGLDQAIRTGLAILTEGILVAPLEGIAGVRIIQNDDGTDAVAVSFAGPIRAAGGTGQALSVLIADVVRRELGIGRYKPTGKEVERLKEEIPAYKISANLQYTPPPEEIDLIVRGCPIMVDGEGTEDTEVGGNRDLPRIETNRLRGGACLVIAEGLTLKAPKIQKHVKNLGLQGWEFIDEFLNKGKSKDDDGDTQGADDGPKKPRIDPNPKFLAELIAGRPVFGYPLRKGGFRLRYGRARTGGLASTAMHPATMHLVDDFLAVGTQMKIERPGKATVATPCDEVEGPIVLLHNGTLREVSTIHDALALKGKVKRIADLGELLVPFGEFSENNKTLPQASYAPEWWAQEVLRDTHGLEKVPAALLTDDARAALLRLHAWKRARAGDNVPDAPTLPPPVPQYADAFADADAAFRFADTTGTPVHPRFNLFWHDRTPDDLARLSRFIEEHGAWRESQLVLPAKPTTAALDPRAPPTGAPGDEKIARSIKDIIVDLGALHEVHGDDLVFGRHGYSLLRGLGLDVTDGRIARVRGPDPEDGEDGVAYASRLAGVTFRRRAPCRIGARMGRPEKAAERKMSPPVHLLFPIGQAGGAQRLLSEAVNAARQDRNNDRTIEVEAEVRSCEKCRRRTILTRCDREACGGHTTPVPSKSGRPEPQRIPLPDMVEAARKSIGADRVPDTIKAVQGLVSARKTPELLEKGILRAKHDVTIFKDGTARFDMTDVPLSHFRPKEVNATVAKLKELGYTHDLHGAPLERDDQVLELKVQDILMSDNGMDVLLKAAQFVDDELARLYNVKPYFRCETRDDLLGHLVVGLAPHTSGGVLARIVGYTTAQVGYAHPFFHAAKRRNCVRGDTTVVLVETKPDGTEKVLKRRIGPWVEKLLADHVEAARFIDAHGTEKLDLTTLPDGALPQWHAITLDPITRVPKRVPVTTVLRGHTKAWVRFTTSGGRKFVCTPDHDLLILDGNAWRAIPAEKLDVGDCVPMCTDLPEDVADGFVAPGPPPCTSGTTPWYGRDVVTRIDWVESEAPTYCLDVDTGSTDLTTKNVLWGNGLYQIRCDGDEDCVMLLLDGLLNFSRAYLPANRGGQMDAPLTLTMRLDPREVDKEAHNVDVDAIYPLEFFEATCDHPSPKDVEKLMDMVAGRLGTPAQYEGFGYTHDTADVAQGPRASAYKTIGDMMSKMEAQLELAAKLQSVDAADVAARVIGSHFLPDLRGNLVAFSKQKMRCTKCNAKYRRIPLKGHCIKCGSNLTMTVHEGSVKKYLEVSKQICEKYGVNNYTRQRIEHIEDSIESVFSNDRVKKAKLSDFF